METLLKNARLVLEHGMAEGDLLVRDGRIASISITRESTGALTPDQTIDLEGSYLAPGLIDIHIHGSHGIDVIDADAAELQRLADCLLEEGITGYIPTIVPIDGPGYRNTLRSIAECIDNGDKRASSYSQVLGVHFEGPFVSEKKCGALHKEFFRTYDGNASSLEIFFAEGLGQFAGDLGLPCRLMTVAPEIAGGIELIGDLTRAGLRCFVGHTAADFETLNKALSAGAVHITHFPNALEPLHHRKPGAVAWGLLTDEVSVDSIADYQHVHPQVLKLIYRMKGPGRMALISDAIPPTCQAEGEYVVWGDRIEIKNGRTRLVSSGAPAQISGEGTIAGSVITLRQAVKNAIGIGIPPHEAILMASLVPARAAGIDRRIASLGAGKVANLVAFDDDMNAKLVLIEGDIRLDKRS